MAVTAQETFEYHRRGRPGKIEVTPTKPMISQRDLSLAYTPGVADVVLEIERRADAAYEMTAKANLVAVISNGTAILGLGDRGALASKPVMEGKGVLFKRFADVDVFDIEVDTRDPQEVIRVVKAIAPTFGGINLEDIKSPECFFIEKTLQDQLDIPVFHDDQHGTAIIASAALLNALEIIGKRIDQIKVVFSGAGAAAIATANMFVNIGVPREHIWMTDIAGLVYHGRKREMFPEKAKFAQGDQPGTLAEALIDADVFVGLSVADLVTPEMIKVMRPDPIIFAMANPNPEIKFEVARAARPDAIVCTGRSDYPNQVNNVLGFPFIFRGALDVQACAINEEMKVAAARALAALAHEDIPDSVLNAYGLSALKYGRDYIIPKPLDPRVMLWVSPAVAEAAMRSGVARRTLDLAEYREQLAERLGQGQRLRRAIINKAKASPKRIVFPEGEEPVILRAAAHLAEEGIGQPILLGRPAAILQKVQDLGLHYTPEIVDPATDFRAATYVQAYYELRQRRGLTLSRAQLRIHEPNRFGMMMVKQGDADACVSGLTQEYPEVIRPALQIFHTRPGVKKAAGAYIVIVKDKVYIFTDATVNIEPSAEDLAEIAVLAADLAAKLNLTPRIAMLSFSNFGSVKHPLAEKVRRATELVRARRPDLDVDGEMQADVAVVPELIEKRFPFSRVKAANVLVFPDLEAANVAYKLVKRLGGAETIGPVLLGVGAPVHVLQAGDDVDEIVSIAAVAVLDAQGQL
jgi:malate dehydrogenase (oxaloacetate-decarboxylating)(NADP+)